MSETIAITIPESLAGWPRRRLEHAVAVAVETGDATAWRRLRNLAAALGFPDIAVRAHAGPVAAKSETPAPPDARETPPVAPPLSEDPDIDSLPRTLAPTRQPSKKVSPSARSRSKPPAKALTPARPEAAESSAPAQPSSRFSAARAHRVRIRSAIPQARGAWFEKWAAARGLVVNRSGDGFLVSASSRAAAALDDLRDHPEFEIEEEPA